MLLQKGWEERENEAVKIMIEKEVCLEGEKWYKCK